MTKHPTNPPGERIPGLAGSSGTSPSTGAQYGRTSCHIAGRAGTEVPVAERGRVRG